MRRLGSSLIIAGTIAGIAFLLLYQDDLGASRLPAMQSGPADLRAGEVATDGAKGYPAANEVSDENALVHSLPRFSRDDVLALGKFGEAFLRERGENAVNLLAVFATTQDRRFLEHALERFPADPAVLYVAFFSPAEEGQDMTELIERFITVDPANPVPHLFSAADLFAKGKAQNAVAALNAAFDRPALYTYFNERADALRELALYGGATKFDAERIAFLAQPMPEFDAAMDASRALQAFIRQQRGNASNANVAPQVQLLYGISRMLQTPEASRSFIGNQMGLILEKEALEVASELPANPLPFELQAQLEKVADLKQQAVDLSKTVSRTGIHPSLRDEYIARCRRDGEVAAHKWAVAQRQWLLLK